MGYWSDYSCPWLQFLRFSEWSGAILVFAPADIWCTRMWCTWCASQTCTNNLCQIAPMTLKNKRLICTRNPINWQMAIGVARQRKAPWNIQPMQCDVHTSYLSPAPPAVLVSNFSARCQKIRNYCVFGVKILIQHVFWCKKKTDLASFLVSNLELPVSNKWQIWGMVMCRIFIQIRIFA